MCDVQVAGYKQCNAPLVTKMCVCLWCSCFCTRTVDCCCDVPVNISLVHFHSHGMLRGGRGHS